METGGKAARVLRDSAGLLAPEQLQPIVSSLDLWFRREGLEAWELLESEWW